MVVDLEMRIIRRSDGETFARLRFEPPNRRTDLTDDTPIALDDADLLSRTAFPDLYGATLTRMVFVEDLRAAWERARGYYEGSGYPVRLRICLEGDDSLHAIRWELLRDPLTGMALAQSERVLLSRFLNSDVIPREYLTRRPKLRAVVAAANPAGSHKPPIDVRGEVDRIRGALASAELTVIDGVEERPRPTVANIAEALRDGADILYVICHGDLKGDEAFLWLEQEGDEPYQPVAGASFVASISQLQQQPVLIILAACKGGGNDYGALTAVGPQLVRAGTGAVIAMQGDVSVKLVAKLMPRLFSELQRDGSIDRALAAARVGLGEDEAWWKPILWLAIRDGALWHRVRPVQKTTAWASGAAVTLRQFFRDKVRPVLGSIVLVLLLSLFFVALILTEGWNLLLAALAIAVSIFTAGLIGFVSRKVRADTERQWGYRIAAYMFAAILMFTMGAFLREQLHLPGELLPEYVTSPEIELVAGGGVLAATLLFWFLGAHRRSPLTANASSHRPIAAILALALALALPLALSGTGGYVAYTPTDRVIILVAQFDGPEPPEKRRFANIIANQLRAEIEPYPQVSVVELREVITTKEQAIDMGAERRASMVIWGAYSLSSVAAPVSVNLEVLCPIKCGPVLEDDVKGVWRTDTSTEQLELFHVQTGLSLELSYLSLYLIGLIQDTIGNPAGAIQAFTDALEQPGTPIPPSERSTILFRRAVVYSDLEDYDKAMVDLQEAALLTPKEGYIHGFIGFVYMVQYQTVEALADLSLALEYEANSIHYSNRAQLYRHFLNNNEQALNDYNEAYKIAFDDELKAMVLADRGDLQAEMGNVDLAFQDFAEAEKLDPDNAQVYSYRADLYEQQDRFQDAIEDYNRAIHLDRDNKHYIGRRGGAYLALNNPNRALVDLNRAIQLKTKSATVYHNRGSIYFERGEYERALPDLNRAINLDNTLGETYFARAHTQAALGHFAEAVDDFTKALPLEEDIADAIYYFRGLAYLSWSPDFTDEAIADLQQVLAISEDEQLRQQAQERLDAIAQRKIY